MGYGTLGTWGTVHRVHGVRYIGYMGTVHWVHGYGTLGTWGTVHWVHGYGTLGTVPWIHWVHWLHGCTLDTKEKYNMLWIGYTLSSQQKPSLAAKKAMVATWMCQTPLFPSDYWTPSCFRRLLLIVLARTGRPYTASLASLVLRIRWVFNTWRWWWSFTTSTNAWHRAFRLFDDLRTRHWHRWCHVCPQSVTSCNWESGLKSVGCLRTHPTKRLEPASHYIMSRMDNGILDKNQRLRWSLTCSVWSSWMTLWLCDWQQIRADQDNKLSYFFPPYKREIRVATETTN